MRNTCTHMALIFSVLAIQAVWLPNAALATSGRGGSGGGIHDHFPVTQPANPEQDPLAGRGGGGGGGGEGFGASPKALAAWEAAGGRKGTGMSFQDWFKKSRVDWDAQQTQLTWEATKAGWGASFWGALFGAAKVADTAGQVSQFGLNFVPGVGKLAGVGIKAVNVGLDSLRGASEGYGQAIDSGMSQSEAAGTGAITGFGTGAMSAGTSILSPFKDAGDAVKAVQAARTAKQILRSNKNLAPAVIGTAVQEIGKSALGGAYTTSVVQSSSPEAQVMK